MQTFETPKANPENLLTIIRDAYDGKVVIPEFQRSFVWARGDIEELLISILQGYFIGTFLMLDTPADKPLFPFRAVEGLDCIHQGAAPHSHTTVRVVLDGQQRITSLFYVLYEPPKLPLKNTEHPYRFFFLLDRALDGDPTDAVVGISEADKWRMTEMDNLRREHRAIPFALMRDPSQFYHWFYGEQQFLKREEDQKLIESFYHRFANFMVPVVALSPETGKNNIVNIFERINRTGVTLSLFDLAVARIYSKHQVKLRELWSNFAKQNTAAAEVVKPEFLLKVIALWEGKEPKKSALLDVIDALDKDRFERQWAMAARFVAEAYRRITVLQGGYGAFQNSWIPYTTLIVPLAVLLNTAEKRKGGEVIYRKLDQWYWASVLTQRYDSAVDTKTHQDVKEVTQWLEGGQPPAWLANLSAEKTDLEVDEPRSALYRGLMCLIVLAGARDFINGQAANLKKCQDDHIFPKSKFSKYPNVNSILNRTLISSNQIKGDKKPSEYLPLFLEEHGNDESRLLQTLQSHMISHEAYEAMKRDDFDSFVEHRRRTFLRELDKRLAN